MRPALNLSVLVPDRSREFFGLQPDTDLRPVFYRVGRESLYRRLLLKVGLGDVRTVLEARFVTEADSDHLREVSAAWLAPEVLLPPHLLASWLDRLPKIRWVYSQVTGTEHLDLDCFMKRGVMVSNAGALSSRRVAEMALACICAHAKRMPGHYRLQRARTWRSLPADDLCRQTVGIIGTGNIGRNVAELCGAIGMQTIGASRNPARFGPGPHPYHRLVRLDEDLGSVLADSDHVVLALPLNQQTRGLIGPGALSTMKPTASLINVARGGLVDERALCAALAEGRLAAAYIERPSRLPPRLFSLLYRTPNLVLTHYSAANSPHSLREAFQQFRGGLRDLIETGRPPNRVA